MRLYCANNNTVYRSVADAARDLNIDRTTIHRYLQGSRSTACNYVFAKLDDLSPDKVKAARAWLLYSAFKIELDCDDAPIIHERGEKL